MIGMTAAGTINAGESSSRRCPRPSRHLDAAASQAIGQRADQIADALQDNQRLYPIRAAALR
jgi:hypothetical protein